MKGSQKWQTLKGCSKSKPKKLISNNSNFESKSRQKKRKRRRSVVAGKVVRISKHTDSNFVFRLKDARMVIFNLKFKFWTFQNEKLKLQIWKVKSALVIVIILVINFLGTLKTRHIGKWKRWLRWASENRVWTIKELGHIAFTIVRILRVLAKWFTTFKFPFSKMDPQFYLYVDCQTHENPSLNPSERKS